MPLLLAPAQDIPPSGPTFVQRPPVGGMDYKNLSHVSLNNIISQLAFHKAKI